MNSMCIMPVMENQNHKANNKVSFKAKLKTNIPYFTPEMLDKFETSTRNLSKDIVEIIYHKGKIRISFSGPHIKKEATNPGGCRQEILSKLDDLIWPINVEGLSRNARNARYHLLKIINQTRDAIYNGASPQKGYQFPINYNFLTGKYSTTKKATT